jgi:hypothetical protein
MRWLLSHHSVKCFLIVDNFRVSSTRNETFSTRYPQCVKPSTLTLSGLIARVLLDATRDLRHLVIDRATFFHELADFLVGVHDCGVISVAKELAQFR